MNLERAFHPRALVIYMMAFDPDESRSFGYACASHEAGADIIEMGIPFSDPIADGPVIQAAGVRALNAGATPGRCISLAGRLRRETGVRVALMTYYNPVFVMGEERFFDLCRRNEIDGVVIPDLPVDEAGATIHRARSAGVDLVLLAAPPTPLPRLERIASLSSGFLYLVARYGTTGAPTEMDGDLSRWISRAKRTLRRVNADLPVCVGFGVSGRDRVRALVRMGSDGVIVGSAVVKVIESGAPERRLKEVVGALSEALHEG